MSEKLKPCPFCGKPDSVQDLTDENNSISCNHCEASVLAELWNNRPGEDAARTEIMIATGLAEYERGRLTAFEEGEQSTIAFIQAHFYDLPDEIECLEKDIADAFQILKEKP